MAMISCQKKKEASIPLEKEKTTPFFWEAANMYFLLTDRFYNGNQNNDINYNRSKETANLRGFEGGDLQGIKQKIEEGYFTDLGVNAIWLTPVVEQIHGAVDEGTGLTYGYHGYWAKDWTALDPNFGSEEDLREVIEAAHTRGIRIVMDVVLNHTGPVTRQDSFWGINWVRKSPTCAFSTYENTTLCSLVENLPDIKSESNQEVTLPTFLKEKWITEGRYRKEVEELETYFKTNQLKKTPRNYIIKWLTDYIRDFGVDAFRVDTAKHVDEASWVVLRAQADKAFSTFKTNNPHKVIDDTGFFMFGEVYNYSINNGREFDFGNKKVDYFKNGFDNLINFQFKHDAQEGYEELFSKYSIIKNKTFQNKSFVNYATSHDDGQPFDKNRERSKETGTKLLLTTGVSQIYYGDETGRNLIIDDTRGDATLRSFMNWEDLKNEETQSLLTHWQKLGQFRRDHPSVGIGIHTMLSESPYVFNRVFTKNEYKDEVTIGLDLPIGYKKIRLHGAFAKAKKIKDTYSGQTIDVIDGSISLDTPYDIVLLEIAENYSSN